MLATEDLCVRLEGQRHGYRRQRPRSLRSVENFRVSSFGAWIPNGRLYKGLRICLVSSRVCSETQQTRYFPSILALAETSIRRVYEPKLHENWRQPVGAQCERFRKYRKASRILNASGIPEGTIARGPLE